MTRQKRRKRAEKDTETTLSRADKLKIAAIIAGMLATLVIGGAFLSQVHNANALEIQLERWRRDYQLNDEQVTRIRHIELEFHGTGNVFTRPSHTLQETREHQRAIAEVMSPESAQRFLTSGEGGGAQGILASDWGRCRAISLRTALHSFLDITTIPLARTETANVDEKPDTNRSCPRINLS